MEPRWSQPVNGRQYDLNKIEEMNKEETFMDKIRWHRDNPSLYGGVEKAVRVTKHFPGRPKFLWDRAWQLTSSVPISPVTVLDIRNSAVWMGNWFVKGFTPALLPRSQLYIKVNIPRPNPAYLRNFSWEENTPNVSQWIPDVEALKQILRVYKGFLQSPWGSRNQVINGTVKRTLLHPSPTGVTASFKFYQESVECIVHGGSPSFDGRCFTCERNMYSPQR